MVLACGDRNSLPYGVAAPMQFGGCWCDAPAGTWLCFCIAVVPLLTFLLTRALFSLCFLPCCLVIRDRFGSTSILFSGIQIHRFCSRIIRCCFVAGSDCCLQFYEFPIVDSDCWFRLLIPIVVSDCCFRLLFPMLFSDWIVDCCRFRLLQV